MRTNMKTIAASACGALALVGSFAIPAQAATSVTFYAADTYCNSDGRHALKMTYRGNGQMIQNRKVGSITEGTIFRGDRHYTTSTDYLFGYQGGDGPVRTTGYASIIYLSESQILPYINKNAGASYSYCSDF